MGVIFKRKISSLNQDDTVRIDSKFNQLMESVGYDIFGTANSSLIPLKEVLIPNYELFEFKEGEEYFGVPTGKEYTNEFGDITQPQVITKDNHPNRLKYKVDEDSILISSLKGARTPALNFDFDLSKYVFSNGFYIFKISNGWLKEFILHLLRTDKLKSVLDNHLYRGIGISSYKESDFLRIKIPRISIKTQILVVKKLEPIKQELNRLKDSKLQSSAIINQVFSNYFKIDLIDIQSLDKKKILPISFSDISKYNSGLRGSARWNKMRYIQDTLYANVDCIETLGRFIQSTKNGWSPLSVEDGEGVPILGQEHFNSDTILKIEPSKATEQTRNNIEDFFIKEGDFFVSRGNTVDLVALASIASEEIEEDIIYPDLYIKVKLDESLVDKSYLAYLFNSFIGRLYFKYVAKGKNQTMVKVSSSELLNFRAPIPEKEIQAEIVETIKTQLDEQKKINQQIAEKQLEINKTIEDAINLNM